MFTRPDEIGGHGPFAGLKPVDPRGERHRPTTRDDALELVLLDERVARLWLSMDPEPPTGQPDRRGVRLAILPGVEPMTDDERLRFVGRRCPERRLVRGRPDLVQGSVRGRMSRSRAGSRSGLGFPRRRSRLSTCHLSGPLHLRAGGTTQESETALGTDLLQQCSSQHGNVPVGVSWVPPSRRSRACPLRGDQLLRRRRRRRRAGAAASVEAAGHSTRPSPSSGPSRRRRRSGRAGCR